MDKAIVHYESALLNAKQHIEKDESNEKDVNMQERVFDLLDSLAANFTKQREYTKALGTIEEALEIGEFLEKKKWFIPPLFIS